MVKKIMAIALILCSFNAVAQEKTAADAIKAAPVTPAKPFVYTPKPTDTVYGKENAPVTIVEYASLSCPHCSHFFTKILPSLDKKYIETGQVKLVYRDFPLNDPALKAAALVQCADKDRREAFIKVLFSTQDKWAFGGNVTDALTSIAQLGGMSLAAFEACMADKELQKTILEVEKEAGDEFKITSTPTFFINNKLHSGDHEIPTMIMAIDAALAQSAKK